MSVLCVPTDTTFSRELSHLIKNYIYKIIILILYIYTARSRPLQHDTHHAMPPPELPHAL